MDSNKAEILICSLSNRNLVRGGAWNVPTGGADSSDKRAKIRFSGYYKCQKSPRNSFSPSDAGLARSDGGARAS